MEVKLNRASGSESFRDYLSGFSSEESYSRSPEFCSWKLFQAGENFYPRSVLMGTEADSKAKIEIGKEEQPSPFMCSNA